MSGTNQITKTINIFCVPADLLVIPVSQAVTAHYSDNNQSECQKLCRGLCAQKWPT